MNETELALVEYLTRAADRTDLDARLQELNERRRKFFFLWPKLPWLDLELLLALHARAGDEPLARVLGLFGADFERDVLPELQPLLEVKVSFGALLVLLPGRLISTLEEPSRRIEPASLEDFYADHGISEAKIFWTNFRHLRLRLLLRAGRAVCVARLTEFHDVDFEQFSDDLVALEKPEIIRALLPAIRNPVDKITLERRLAQGNRPLTRGQASPMHAPKPGPASGGQPPPGRRDSGHSR